MIAGHLLSDLDLVYRPEPEMPTMHGFIELAVPMTFEQYHNAFAMTQRRWIIVPIPA